MALYLSGHLHRAQRALDETARTVAGHVEEEIWVLGLLALIAADQGRWDDTVELDRQIREKTTHPAENLPPILAHALALAHCDDTDLGDCLEESERNIREFFSPTEWRMILSAATVFAGIALRRDDVATAERWTAEAETILTRYPDAGILRGSTKQLRKALEERRMAEPLTDAERRVLDLLPTQLTAEGIANHLFLTRNTVKSHMGHIYRKLGVSSRTAAVETARRLGLL